VNRSFASTRRALLCAAVTLPLAALAQSAYPTRPVSIVVPYSPGGATDVVARVAAHYLGPALKGTFIVDNKPGASGTIAMAHVAKSAPDGQTLLMNEITSTVVGVLVPKLTFDPQNDFTPVAMIAETPYVLLVNNNLPVKSVAELVAYAKANPGKLNYGSGGVGSGPHIAGELFKSLAKVDINHVPYKGSGPALQDLIGGQIDMLVTAAPAVASLGRRSRLARFRHQQLVRPRSAARHAGEDRQAAERCGGGHAEEARRAREDRRRRRRAAADEPRRSAAEGAQRNRQVVGLDQEDRHQERQLIRPTQFKG